MKNLRIFASLLLVIAMMFAIASCDLVEQYLPGNDQPEHTHSFVEGKCECGESDPDYVAPHVHSFVNGECECGESDPNYVPPHVHEYVDGKCECGANDPDFVQDGCVNHVWDENSVALGKDATCTEDGHYTITCSVCGYTRKYDVIDAFGHTDTVETVEPTCTEGGSKTSTCTVCGDVRVVEYEAHGHGGYTKVETAPTCTEAGYTTYYCGYCDAFAVADEVAPLGHTFIDGKCVKCDAEYVPAPATGEWTLITELKTGDHVLIGAPAYGKLLSATKTGYYNIGVNYAADNFANVTDAEIWVVTVNDDGTYSFVSATGDILALSTYASLNVEGQHKTWTVESAGADTFYIKNVGRGNYLEWYAQMNNWSTYATSNLSDLFEMSFYAKGEAEGEHVHNHISDAHENTCTEDGYTTYTCKCGDTYSVAGEAATGHKHETTVVAPTCTEAGYTEHLCACGDSYNTDETAALGHAYADGKCANCGAEDPDYHVHNYVDVITTPATCTATGVMTPTCSCGDTKEPVELEMLPHVDENLDITCDYEGCSKRILPAADSKVSLFTANHMVIISLTNNYYVEGTVTSVEDARNGKFIITDDAGDTILIYLPVDADGITHANWVSKVVVGDVVSVYGKPVNTSGLNTDQKAAVKSGVLTFITKHPHVFGEPTCTKPGYCECGQDGPVALGHADNDGDKLCDACGWNVTYSIENVTTKYNDIKNTDKADTTNGVATFNGEDFDVIFEKNTAAFNTNGTDHMRMNKGNKVTIQSLNGKKIVGLIIAASSASYVDELELFLQAAGYQYTVDGTEATIYFDATESIVIENTSSKAQRIAGFKIIYEAPVAKAEPVTVVMDNTITDTQSFDMTGGNDAALVGLDAEIFTVTSDKGSYGSHPFLYYKSSLAAPSQIRLYNHSSANGNSITVSVAEGYEIVSIKITFAITGRANGYVITNAEGTELANVATDATIDNVEVSYDVNSNSFTFKNVHTGTSKQIWIDSIEIVYQEV